jgi:hypothetical protein
MQALARQRFGFQRLPVATAVVFVVTATTSILGAGLVGELAGYVWQPRGAGNSVAICGLAGALTVALLVGARAPRLAPVVLVYWCGALLASRWGPGLLLVGVAGGVVVQLALGRGVPLSAPWPSPPRSLPRSPRTWTATASRSWCPARTASRSALLATWAGGFLVLQ